MINQFQTLCKIRVLFSTENFEWKIQKATYFSPSCFPAIKGDLFFPILFSSHIFYKVEVNSYKRYRRLFNSFWILLYYVFYPFWSISTPFLVGVDPFWSLLTTFNIFLSYLDILNSYFVSSRYFYSVFWVKNCISLNFLFFSFRKWKNGKNSTCAEFSCENFVFSKVVSKTFSFGDMDKFYTGGKGNQQ